MKWDSYGGSILAGIVFVACLTLAPPTARSEDCPAPNRLERLGAPKMHWMTLCIPPGNDLYRVKDGRLQDLFWRDDLQIPQPAGYDPAKLGVDRELTVATIWHNDHSESAGISGSLTASILNAAQSGSPDGTFVADVPFQGHVFPVRFERLDGGLLRGTYTTIESSNSTQSRVFIFLLRPIGVNGRPQLAMCPENSAENGPEYMCIVFATAANQEVMMMVASDDPDKSFRLSEEIAGKLNAFATLPKAP